MFDYLHVCVYKNNSYFTCTFAQACTAYPRTNCCGGGEHLPEGKESAQLSAIRDLLIAVGVRDRVRV